MVTLAQLALALAAFLTEWPPPAFPRCDRGKPFGRKGMDRNSVPVVAIRFEMLGFGCVPNGAGSGFGLSTTVGYFSL